MQKFPKGDWRNLKSLWLCIFFNMKSVLPSVIKDASISQDAICPFYKTFIFVRELILRAPKYGRRGSAPSLQGKMGQSLKN